MNSLIRRVTVVALLALLIGTLIYIDSLNRNNLTLYNKGQSIAEELKGKDIEHKEEIEAIKAELNNVKSELSTAQKTLSDTKKRLEEQETSRGIERTLKAISMTATAYDLSVESCGKPRDHKEYGITRTGTKVEVGRTVAVDPKVIPLHSLVYIVFPEKYSFLNGYFVAEDTGNAVKGKIVDIYLGEDSPGDDTISKVIDNFGRQKVAVYVVNKGGFKLNGD